MTISKIAYCNIKILQNGMLTSRPIVTFSSRLPQRRNPGVTCSLAEYRSPLPTYGACATTSIRPFSGRCAPLVTSHSGTDKTLHTSAPQTCTPTQLNAPKSATTVSLSACCQCLCGIWGELLNTMKSATALCIDTLKRHRVLRARHYTVNPS